MGWLGDGSNRGQGRQAGMAVGLPQRYPLNTMKKKQNNTKQNYPVLVASYDTPSVNKVGLFYNAQEPTRTEKN